MRLIDLDLLKGKVAAMQACEPHYAFHFLNDAQNPSTEWECIEDMIENIPVIEAQPVKRGKWITTQKTIDDGITTCSYCHREFYIDDLVPVGNAAGFCEFCPACGSDNRGDSDEAKALIENGKVNGRYNYCMICGQHISKYKQICHECEVKYSINWGDSIAQKNARVHSKS